MKKKSTRDLVTPHQLIVARGDRTQEKLAELWYTPATTIQGWEQGKRSRPGIIKRVIELEQTCDRLQAIINNEIKN